MNKILITGFKGLNNVSQILTEKIDGINIDKLLLVNSFSTSESQLLEKLENNYDYIIMFGQKPNTKNIYIEKSAHKSDEYYESNFNYINLNNLLQKDYPVVISNDAGDYLCNNIYFMGLKYIYNTKIQTAIIFIHLPSLKNINNIDRLVEIFNEYIDDYR